jgi:hypothetical protein
VVSSPDNAQSSSFEIGTLSHKLCQSAQTISLHKVQKQTYPSILKKDSGPSVLHEFDDTITAPAEDLRKGFLLISVISAQGGGGITERHAYPLCSPKRGLLGKQKAPLLFVRTRPTPMPSILGAAYI